MALIENREVVRDRDFCLSFEGTSAESRKLFNQHLLREKQLNKLPL